MRTTTSIAPLPPRARSARREFMACDKDRDGKVTKAELAKVQEQRQKQMAERRAEEFGRLDKNGDGALSFAEMLGRLSAVRGDAPKTAGEMPRAPAAPGGEAGGRDRDISARGGACP